MQSYSIFFLIEIYKVEVRWGEQSKRSLGWIRCSITEEYSFDFQFLAEYAQMVILIRESSYSGTCEGLLIWYKRVFDGRCRALVGNTFMAENEEQQ